MRFSSRFLNHCLTGLVGVIAGVCYERSNGFNYKFSNIGILQATATEQISTKSPFLNQIRTVDDNLKNRTSIIMKYGFPSFENVKNYNNFVIGYDKRLRNSNWVIEHMNEDTLTNKTGKLVNRQGMEFFPDPAIHEYFRAVNDDFKNSGYDRGHLAAAGNHPLSYEDMNRTFVLSNISPQIGVGFNRDIWNTLEVYVRYRAKRSRNLWVATGPLWLAKREEDGKNYIKYEVIGKNQIAVPTHFFKVLLIELNNGTFEFENYVIENTKIKNDTPLRNFQVPLDVIERSSGFLLFEGFKNKNQIMQNNPKNPYLDDFKFKKRTFNKLPPNKINELSEPIAPAA